MTDYDAVMIAAKKLTIMKKLRLLRLANKLLGEGPYVKVGPPPSHKFEMQRWWSTRKGNDGFGCGVRDFNPDQCKTAACACGWAAVDPWFVKRNFGTRPYLFKQFFGLFDRDFNKLFVPDAGAKKTTQGVGNAIRRFVEANS